VLDSPDAVITCMRSVITRPAVKRSPVRLDRLLARSRAMPATASAPRARTMGRSRSTAAEGFKATMTRAVEVA